MRWKFWERQADYFEGIPRAKRPRVRFPRRERRHDMRLKFWKKEPDYDDIEFVKPRRPRETLSQTAEKILHGR